MSLNQIVENIKNNIQDREGANTLLEMLEIITRFPITFGPLVRGMVHDTLSEAMDIDVNNINSEDPTVHEELPVKRRFSGFNCPVQISNDMMMFLSESGLILDAAVGNISSISMLSTALPIYMAKYQLKSGNLIIPDSLMTKCFGESEPFRYSHLVVIIKRNIKKVPEESLTTEVLDKLEQRMNNIKKIAQDFHK